MTDADVLSRVAAWKAPHAAVAVVRPGGGVAVHGDQGRPFALASATKLLTAAAAWVAAEEGTVAFDAPVAGVWCDVRLPEGVTVAHLLAHASGLPPEPGGPVTPPGRRRVYSNLGFDVLAAVIEDASGIPFPDYLYEAVCEPLGMESTRLHGSAAKDGVSTASDLTAFAAELLCPGRIVAPATLARATTVRFGGLRGVVPGFGMQDANDWGLGCELRDAKTPHWTGRRNSPSTFGHFGQSGTFVWADPDARLACVCLTDRAFDSWAKEAWPAFSDDILTAFGSTV